MVPPPCTRSSDYIFIKSNSDSNIHKAECRKAPTPYFPETKALLKPSLLNRSRQKTPYTRTRKWNSKKMGLLSYATFQGTQYGAEVEFFSGLILIVRQHVWIREGNHSAIPLIQTGKRAEGTAAWGMPEFCCKAHSSETGKV